MDLTKLQIKPLSGSVDWPIWKRRIRNFLDYHDGALNVIDGLLVKPAPLDANATEVQRKQFSEKTDQFRKANSYSKSIITSALTEDTYRKVMDKETAKEVWDELKRNFEASSKDQLFKICSDFFGFSWNMNDDVSCHVAKLKTLWNELNTGLEQKGENKLPDMMLICKILHILPVEYQTFKTSWMLLADEKQTVNEMVNQLCTVERDVKARAVGTTNQEALVVKPVMQKPNQSKSKTSKQKGKQSGNCNYCHEPGHWVKNCSKWIADGKPPKNATSNKNSSTSNVVLTICAEALTAEVDTGEWFFDNGATKHVTNRGDVFLEFEKFNIPHFVTAAGSEALQALGKGTIRVLSIVDEQQQILTLADVWYVPKINRNLFSVLAAQDRNPNTTVFHSSVTECWLKVNGQVVLQGARKQNGTLYRANVQVLQSESVDINIVDANSTLQLYHERFGHQNKHHVKNIVKRELEIDIKVDSKEICESCMYGKARRQKFGSRESATKPGEMFSADVCGPFDESFGKYRYYVSFKDHFSKIRFLVCLKNKSDVTDALKDVIQKVKAQGHVIKEFLSDNGGEFDNEGVRRILCSNGITQRLTAPYTPQQNGCSERDNRTIVEMARTLKYSNPDIDFPPAMWAELCNTAVYILNRTGKSSVEEKSPWEIWTGKKPRIKHLRIVGSVCFVHIPDCKRRKMDKKAVKGFLVGYDGDERYRVYIKEEHKVILSRDVVFQETVKDCSECVELPRSAASSSKQETEQEQQTTNREYETDSESDTESEGEDDHINASSRQLRDKAKLQKPSRFNDYVMATEVFNTDMNTPESYEEAVSCTDHEQWLNAMNSEMNSLVKNQTWELTDLPANAQAIPCKWVYKTKMNPDGSVEKHKARLVVKGFNQRKGIDYSQTFSPVARHSTIRSVLSIAAIGDMHLKQFDVSTAFLYGELDETVFMKQPQGYSDGTNRVCRLKKSLYGLKQAPRCWNKRFQAFLMKHNFKTSAADPCLYMRWQNEKQILLALYVDDGLVAATDVQELDSFLSQLKSEFEITIKEATYFLGIEIKREQDGSIKISQPAYAKKVLERFGFENCKSVATPMIKNLEDSFESGKVESNFPYRELVGALMFLMTGTRPDLAYSVGYLSRVLDKSTTEDIVRAKRVLRYVAGTIDKGIVYQPRYNPGILECYSDADFAGCNSTGRSTSGVVVCHAGGAISWLSQRQTMVTTSTTEAEFVAATEAAKEIIWLKRLFTDTGTLRQTPTLYVDNSAAVKLAQNPEFHRRTKHIDVKYFFVREKVSDGNMNICQIATEHQVADIMTKPLNKVRLSELCDKMGLSA
jgi:hypothetical protein